jgi:hypothetical protein
MNLAVDRDGRAPAEVARAFAEGLAARGGAGGSLRAPRR